jgi:hypothetical protein
MRTKGKLAIGAALILAVMAGAFTSHWLTEQQFEWAWGLRAPNGHPGFALHFNEHAWAWVSGGPPSALARTILTDRTDTRLTSVIEHGLAAVPNGCPGRWLLAQVHVLPDQSVFVSGYCATEAELEKARGNSYARSGVL